MPISNTTGRIFFFALALLCAGLAARRLYIQRLFNSESTNVIAEVLPGSVSNSFTHSGSPYVKYAFTLPPGRTFRSSQGGYSGRPGDTILVEYVRTHPQFNRVAGSAPMGQRLVWLFTILAALFLLISARLKLPD